MDDITLSYTDDYRLRTYTATLQHSINYSIDRDQLSNSPVDHEYLICAQLIDRVNNSFYNYSSLGEIARNLREVQRRTSYINLEFELLDIAIARIEAIIAPSSRLVSKQQIHQLLQGGTNGPAAYNDQRHAVQSLTRTTPRDYQQAGDTVPELNAWSPGTSTTGQDHRMDAHNNSQVHV